MAATKNTVSLAAAYALGIAAWLIVLAVGPGATPLDSGPHLLFALGVGGLLVALVRGELEPKDLLALYAGQASGLLAQAHFDPGYPSSPGVLLQLLFLVSFNLAAALGGAVPGILTHLS